MITKWKAFNFKSVRQETELEFAPMTIFAGANSSGKSTFLQTILLIAQTLAHKVSSRSVVLNGALTRLGQFDDLRSVDSEANQIVIGLTVQPQRDLHSRRTIISRRTPYFYGRSRYALSTISCEIAFETDEGSGTQKEITQIQPRLFSSQLSALTRDPEEGDQRFFMNIRHATVTDDVSKQKWIGVADTEDPSTRTSLQYDVELDVESLADIHEDLVSAKPVGCLIRHFLPDRLSLGIDLVAEDARQIIRVISGDNLPVNAPRRYIRDREIIVPQPIIDFILNLAGSIDEDARRMLKERLQSSPNLFNSEMISLEHLTEALHRLQSRFRREIRQQIAESQELIGLVNSSIRDDREEEPTIIGYRLPVALTEAAWYLDDFFSTSVRYLGPLRDEPKSLYPLSPSSDPSDVGLKGEHTAAVLEMNKNRVVQYIPTSAFLAPEIIPQTVKRTLETAVIDWLRYLGVAEHVESRDKGKFGHELTVSIAGSKRPHDLTHVGVGVSQVLPILVTSLLAEPDTTLIFEQPELHLHPKVQTLLADFFLSMTQIGKQCIVETHSEYLINRIRFRAAAAVKSSPWVDSINMYFVEKDSKGSTFRKVDINEYGAILDWPEGFFDQSQRESEAIIRAASIKRKKKREQKQ